MKTLFERMSDAQSQTDPAVEKVARAILDKPMIEVCREAADKACEGLELDIQDAQDAELWMTARNAAIWTYTMLQPAIAAMPPSDDIARVVAWLRAAEYPVDWTFGDAHTIADAIEAGDWKAIDPVSQDGGNG